MSENVSNCGLVDLADIQAARAQLDGVARVTPLEGSRVLTEQVDGPVWLKCENLQRTGSFKLRGAYVRMARLGEHDLSAGVVAASAGNHAQGVALAAALLGTTATVYMPMGSPLPKIRATEDYGAKVVLEGERVDSTLATASAFAEATGRTLIHPFDHPDVIAGQGTIGLELLDQCPDVRTVVVSAGGGGLVSGVAAALKGLRPEVRVVAAQARGAASMAASLAAGRPVSLTSISTMADGIAVARPGELTFRHVRALVDRLDVVGEDALARALVLAVERAKLIVEPAGAAALAAVMEDPRAFEPPVVVVLSGGNIDPLLLSNVVRRGVVASGRFLTIRVTIADRPGELARLLGVLAGSRANVLEVVQRRIRPSLHVGDVEVDLQVEARGPAHLAEVQDAVLAAGYSAAHCA